MLAKLMSLFLLGLIRVLTGAQARWHGCPPKAEQRIYFPNHQSHVDLVMKALKRDRVDALCFAAPVFFHSVQWFFNL